MRTIKKVGRQQVGFGLGCSKGGQPHPPDKVDSMGWFVSTFHWIAIYPGDSVVQPLNNLGLEGKRTPNPACHLSAFFIRSHFVNNNSDNKRTIKNKTTITTGHCITQTYFCDLPGHLRSFFARVATLVHSSVLLCLQ